MGSPKIEGAFQSDELQGFYGGYIFGYVGLRVN